MKSSFQPQCEWAKLRTAILIAWLLLAVNFSGKCGEYMEKHVVFLTVYSAGISHALLPSTYGVKLKVRRYIAYTRHITCCSPTKYKNLQLAVNLFA